MTDLDKFPGILLTGVQSGLWYLKTIQSIAQELKGIGYVFPLKIIQLPFQEINAILPHKMEEAAQQLLPYFEEMKKINAQPFILANSTLHETFNHYPPGFSKETQLLSIEEIVVKKLPVAPQKLAILGTAYTMNSGYIKSLIPKNHEIISLNKNHQKKVDDLRITFNHHLDADQAKNVFQELTDQYPEVDYFIISCTELAVALDFFENKTKFFNLSYLQCEGLVSRYLTKHK